MKVGELLRDLGRPVAYYPALVPVAGSVNASILLCQLLYWDGKQDDPEGWIYKTQDDLREETGLTRAMQEEARDKLRKNGILEEVKRGIPAKLYYRIDQDALQNAWDARPSSQPRMRKSSRQSSALCPTLWRITSVKGGICLWIRSSAS